MTETPRWTASSYSSGDGGQCVEWAPAHALATGEFLVRDSKVQNGPHLTLSRESFAGLVALARARG
ncbi:DUF397 domain-containing protein [Streptomyces albidoflavus]|uniref:DUF397 domain-containing protein n=1 Tax=Streptomyces albidoflavus TaxID=1886 RepID=A0A126Y323_9ACTN|nr:DUF397 domain-containing protein [Streptomyces albidoflavus]AMM09368.1 hypothetical protein Salbus254_2866 [Streptomyces albidoflavus]RZE24042.1 DUF397 domain-containing protein [Streptomyces albidoflavus]RZE45458.1 DUF397 domain-containing protein [Streptomyces albidoflavus]